MTGKQALGLEDDEAGDGAGAPRSDADAPPGGDTEAGRDAEARRRIRRHLQRQSGVKRGGNSGQAAGGKDTGQESADGDGTAGDGGGIAQLRHLVSELIKGAEKKTASKLNRLEKQGKTLAESAEANAVMLRQLVERQPGAGAGSEGAMKLLERIGIHAADFGRWVELERRGRRRWWALAIAAGFPAFLLLGLLAGTAVPGHSAPRPHRRAGAATSGSSMDEPSSIARSRR